MGISIEEEFCYFPPARTGSHSVNLVLRQFLKNKYKDFHELPKNLFAERQYGNFFYEWGGDHTRAAMFYRLMPQASHFRSASSFRDPLQRVASIYAYTSEKLGVATNIEKFDDWVRLVFCNNYNDIWLAHGLQTSIFMDSRSLPCVTRIYAIDRLADLLEFLLPGSGAEVPQVNSSSAHYLVYDLRASTQRRLLNRILPDLEFWDSLRIANGCYIC